MDIAKKIKELRESLNLKQSEMANKLGVEQANYSYLERRGKKLTIEQLEQIATALGVSIKEILFGEQADISEVELSNLKTKNALLEKEIEVKNRDLELKEKDSKLFERAFRYIMEQIDKLAGEELTPEELKKERDNLLKATALILFLTGLGKAAEQGFSNLQSFADDEDLSTEELERFLREQPLD